VWDWKKLRRKGPKGRGVRLKRPRVGFGGDGGIIKSIIHKKTFLPHPSIRAKHINIYRYVDML